MVVGAPGGGKTSLFRTHLIRAVEARRAGELETSLPILVSAAALSGKPLAAALAEAATAELSGFGLLEKLPDDLFKKCPYEDVPWLVMVDGLDEITDTAGRRKLLAALDQISDGGRGRQYRFVIATRPLPEWELAVLGAQAPVYELEPFTWSDLNRVSADWFRVLGLENPDRVAERFASAVRRTRVFGLARTPLMAALLCQLHGANPDAPLPASRGEIYRKYVEQLTRRMQGADTSGIQAQVRASLPCYGDEALGEGWRTLERLLELISRSAAEMQGGSSVSILDIFSGLPGAERPKRVPATVWREYLQSLLQRSGLVILRGGSSSTSAARFKTLSPATCSGWSPVAAWPGAVSSPFCSVSAPMCREASFWRWRRSSWISSGSWVIPWLPRLLVVLEEWFGVIRSGSRTPSWLSVFWPPPVRRTRSTG
ncbi:hypothetical protein AB0M80_23460 [Amycolatopsis sp. NPDC051045]|uniref:NACHT domain-containing protein n=1 Tax=Amycolatopsis sp. NPDC051045 TaxID=3156922 RepID=UPI00343067D4